MVEPVGSDAQIVGCNALVDLQSERIKDALVAETSANGTLMSRLFSWLKWVAGLLLVVGVVGCGSSSGGSARARIVVTPSVGLWDQPRTIVVSDLDVGQPIEVRARSPRPGGLWVASATFKANARGIVDLSQQAPRSGSYRKISAMGLFWSQHQVSSGSAPGDRVVTTLTVTSAGHQLASAHVTQLRSTPGVSEHDERLSTVGFVGHYFAPPGLGRHPAIIVWGGSEGGLAFTIDDWAVLLASHGIPTLGIAYFDAPGLPCRLQQIPLQYFARAISWLRSQPQVDPNRVWILSSSRGTEAELLVAADYPKLVHGIVAEAPSAFANGALRGTCAATHFDAPAWTFNDKPIADNTPLPANRIDGPALLISGADDTVWPSDLHADQIMAALPHNGNPHIHLNYPDAGHLVLGIPYTPILPSELAAGGTTAGNNAAHTSDWPAMITFIAQH
jgi:pimeloyl-ACP methyl ester carboxylesterase